MSWRGANNAGSLNHEGLSLLEPTSPLAPAPVTAPEELVEVPMLHVLEDHDEGIALHTHAVELDDVLVLEVGQQLGLAVKVLACVVTSVLQCLGTRGREERKPTHRKWRMPKRRLC